MDEIASFWQAYLSYQGTGTRTAGLTYTAWPFGNHPAMADELGALVVAGLKTATCTLFWEAQEDGDLPVLGGLSMILDGRGRPLCIIETNQVEIKPFDGVDARFAYEEGEGDRSYEQWRENHWRYFSKICLARGWEMTGSMLVVCERFRLLYRKQEEN